MARVPCDYGGWIPGGCTAAWYVTTDGHGNDTITSSRFACDRHLRRAEEVVGHNGRAVTVSPLGEQGEPARARR